MSIIHIFSHLQTVKINVRTVLLLCVLYNIFDNVYVYIYVHNKYIFLNLNLKRCKLDSVINTLFVLLKEIKNIF